MWREIWRRLQGRPQEKVMYITISGDALAKFEKLANEMDAHPKTVVGCALTLLDLIIQYAKEGGELTGKDSQGECDIVLLYENKHGQMITLPPEEDNDTQPRNILLLSDKDKRFLKKIGIKLD